MANSRVGMRVWAREVGHGYTDGMDTAAKRPWYRLHWGTVLVVFFVGLAWLHHAFPESIGWLFKDRGYHVFLSFNDVSSEGWPFACMSISISSSHSGIEVGSPLLLGVDIAVAVASLISVAFVAERLERNGPRFSLATLASFVTSVAMLLAFWRWQDRVRNEKWFPLDSYVPLDLYHWHGFLCVLIAIGCTFFAITRLAIRAASWSTSPPPPAPAKVEANGSPAQ